MLIHPKNLVQVLLTAAKTLPTIGDVISVGGMAVLGLPTGKAISRLEYVRTRSREEVLILCILVTQNPKKVSKRVSCVQKHN